MFPLRDNIPTRTTPVVNYALIAASVLVFIVQLQDPPDAPSLVERLGMIPARIVHPDAPIEITVGLQQVRTPHGIETREVKRPAAPPAVPAVLTMLTCIFLHGGWMHLLGNMWFLLIFGDNVEDRFGHVGYLIFYVFCGVAASLVHFLSEMSSTLPTIGASGAIAGVMGAYFVWYPRAQVQALLPIFIFIQIIVVPAPIFLGIWFLFQFFSGAVFINGTEASGVAWWAHIGGFLAGAAVAAVIGRTSLVRPENPTRRPGTNHPGFYRIPSQY